MHLRFTKHARQRMEDRGISEVRVETAVDHPDKLERSTVMRTRFVAKKMYRVGEAKRLLLVIYEEAGPETLVVTVIDTSKVAKYY